MNLFSINTPTCSAQTSSSVAPHHIHNELVVSATTTSSQSRATGVALLALRTQERLEPISSSSLRKIQYPCDNALWFGSIPDVGMENFVVTNGSPIGTRGVGPSFVICMIGQTKEEPIRPVLGLCNKGCLQEFARVHDRLTEEMVLTGKANCQTIVSYVIGGEASTEGGGLEEEAEIKEWAPVLKIEEALFNATVAEDDSDSLAVVLTPEAIYVRRKNPLFLEGQEDGRSLFGPDDEDYVISSDTDE